MFIRRVVNLFLLENNTNLKSTQHLLEQTTKIYQPVCETARPNNISPLDSMAIRVNLNGK